VSEHASSYRRILKTSSIIGGASVLNILIGMLRTKMLAALIGPSGVGLVSLYSGVISTGTIIASMGIGTIGTRDVAAALNAEDQRALALVRRAMFWGSILLAGFGSLAVWSLRELIAQHVLGGVEHSTKVGWLALAVAFSVVGTSQGALIQGMRRIGDMARLSVYGAVLNTALGIGLLWEWKATGLVAYVLVGPLASFLLGQWYVSRLGPAPVAHTTLQELTQKWNYLLKMGVPFMGAALVSAAVQLWIRVEVGDSLGAEGLGHFQAATSISMQYIGFVLTAMGADYYPRLTGVIDDPAAAKRLVNEQTEIALLLSAPIFVAMIGVSPWVISLLYTAAFAPAAEILRWQILGDVLKVASWPLGFVIVAVGAGKTYFWTESIALFIMGGIIAWLAPSIGLKITGIAFLIMYAVYLPLVYLLAKRRIAFGWSRSVKTLVAITFSLCLLIALISAESNWGPAVGIIFSIIFGIYSLIRIARMSDMDIGSRRVAALAERIVKLIKR
jgi:O-antigen/teichoic acid export membrane protein